MRTVLLSMLDRINAAHPWSHNDAYHRWILRQVPNHATTSLDVGCGTGNLVRALAGRVDRATGIDTDRAVVDLARSRSTALPTVTFEVRDLRDPPDGSVFDVVTAVAVVHHLPLPTALARLRSLVAPGGRVVVVGCYRAATRGDRLLDLVAVPANLVMGLLLSARSFEARVAMSAPTAPPTTTLAEVRAVAARILPGARVRRRLFWRYSLVYSAPERLAPGQKPNVTIGSR